MKSILLTFLSVISTSLCSFNPQKTGRYLLSDQWSTIIQAKSEHSSIPSQYFICGFDFLQLKWTRQLQNCNCRKYPWFYVRSGYKCDKCTNTFYNQCSGFSVVFCNYNNWYDQITKNFTTASPNSGAWKGRVMCPMDSYATGFTPKFGYELKKVLGLHGLILRCTTTDYKHSQNVQDNQITQGTFMQVKFGNFISGVEVKYEPEGKLTGINMYAEGMPIISDIQVQYAKDSYDNYPVNIGSQLVENCASMTSQKKVSLAKTYKTTCKWNLKNTQVRGYAKFSNISMPPPNFLNGQATNTNILYKETRSQFGFQNPVSTDLSTDEQILVHVPSSTSIKISTIVQQQKGNIAFSANLTIINMVTGAFITKYPIQGVWSGFTTSSVSTKIFQTKIKCQIQTPDLLQGDKSNVNQKNLRL